MLVRAVHSAVAEQVFLHADRLGFGLVAVGVVFTVDLFEARYVSPRVGSSANLLIGGNYKGHFALDSSGGDVDPDVHLSVNVFRVHSFLELIFVTLPKENCIMLDKDLYKTHALRKKVNVSFIQLISFQ